MKTASAAQIKTNEGSHSESAQINGYENWVVEDLICIMSSNSFGSPSV